MFINDYLLDLVSRIFLHKVLYCFCLTGTHSNSARSRYFWVKTLTISFGNDSTKLFASSSLNLAGYATRITLVRSPTGTETNSLDHSYMSIYVPLGNNSGTPES